MTSILRSIGFKKAKHQKLAEEMADSCQEPVREGVTFFCKYLGSTPIEQSSNPTMTSHAVKHILSMAKAKGKKLPNIILHITPVNITGTSVDSPPATSGTSSNSDSDSAKSPSSADNNNKDLISNNNNNKKKSPKKKKPFNNNKNGGGSKSAATEAAAAIISEETSVAIDQQQESTRMNSDQENLEPKAEELSKDSLIGSGGHDLNNKQQSENVQLFNISIYKIPYCFAESHYDRVVSFVSTNPNGAHECHAIMADKRKVAHSIALNISHAFDIAFDRMKSKKEESNGGASESKESKDDNNQDSQQQQQQQPESGFNNQSDKSSSSSSSASSSTGSDIDSDEQLHHQQSIFDLKLQQPNSGVQNQNPQQQQQQQHYPALTLTKNQSFGSRIRRPSDNKENSALSGIEPMEVDSPPHSTIAVGPKLLINLDGDFADLPVRGPDGRGMVGLDGKRRDEFGLEELRDLF